MQYDGKGKPLECLNCGKYIGQNRRGTRRTCSARCRQQLWRRSQAAATDGAHGRVSVGAVNGQTVEAVAEPPQSKKKVSATALRESQLAGAAKLLEDLREDLQGVLDGWGDSFAGSDRSERFQDAVAELEGIIEMVEAVDLSW